MTLETHPAVHYLVELLFYLIGVTFNVLLAAHLSVRSKTNAIMSIQDYLKLRWVPVGARYFICVCMFLILWENPYLFSLEKFMPNLPAHMGVGGALGWLSDSVWDKLLPIFLPGIQKELPAVPVADDQNGH